MTTIEERLRRLEDAVSSLVFFVTDGRPSNAERSISAGQHGAEINTFVVAVAAERAEREP